MSLHPTMCFLLQIVVKFYVYDSKKLTDGFGFTPSKNECNVMNVDPNFEKYTYNLFEPPTKRLVNVNVSTQLR